MPYTVDDLDVEDAIDVQGHVVPRNSDLGGNFDCLFPQIVNILDGVDDGDLEIEARLQLSLVLFESVKHESIVFGHDDGEAKESSIILPDPLGVHLAVSESVVLGEETSLSEGGGLGERG
eukprot:CAMPEP_0168608284 /NCGR_PEP_ID=MMETSP0449_2-20121227/540_1 /TAXON_ID=1082188 /ORGANISM="Strombidium rassoulzadegani, Strain ras09" /LENGTH=119 /DNA_ID=CAMNT_0008648249 /DNA_START=603 /DNA_END=963 /DNA_ORIENTATION=-